MVALNLIQFFITSAGNSGCIFHTDICINYEVGKKVAMYLSNPLFLKTFNHNVLSHYSHVQGYEAEPKGMNRQILY